VSTENTPTPRQTDEELLTVAQIATRLKLNQQTIRNWIDQGRLPAVRIGRRVRIKRTDFEQLLTTAAGPATPAGRPPAYTAEQFWDDEPHPPPALTS
jgi:excisionase family DNA binding protein